MILIITHIINLIDDFNNYTYFQNYIIYFFNKSRAFKKNRKYQNGIFSILF